MLPAAVDSQCDEFYDKSKKAIQTKSQGCQSLARGDSVLPRSEIFRVMSGKVPLAVMKELILRCPGGPSTQGVIID